MNYQEAWDKAIASYGENIEIVRKPKNGFTASNPIPTFLGEITSPSGHNDSWWVYRKNA